MENKKEIGGFEIADGFVIGPAFFSAMGKKSTVLTCPPIWAFNYGVSNAINQLSKMEDSSDELQTAFNSLLDNLISEVPVYLKIDLGLLP